MASIEDEIAGPQVQETVEYDEIELQRARQRLIASGVTNGESEQARQKSLEVKYAWVHHEGTAQFIAQLQMIRETKLAEAENLAKVGHTEHAIRLLLQSCSIKETIDIIKNPSE